MRKLRSFRGPGANSISRTVPRCATSTRTEAPGFFAAITSPIDRAVTRTPSTARISSCALRPAREAGEPSSTVDTTAAPF